MKTLLTMTILGITLGACSSPPQAPVVVQKSPAEIAAAREAAEVVPVMDSTQMAQIKQTLQSEGKACTQIVDTHPREAENKLDVVCIETAGGTQRVTHTIDLGAI